MALLVLYTYQDNNQSPRCIHCTVFFWSTFQLLIDSSYSFRVSVDSKSCVGHAVKNLSLTLDFLCPYWHNGFLKRTPKRIEEFASVPADYSLNVFLIVHWSAAASVFQTMIYLRWPAANKLTVATNWFFYLQRSLPLSCVADAKRMCERTPWNAMYFRFLTSHKCMIGS